MASEKEQAEQSALIRLESLEVPKSRHGGGAGFEESGLIDLSGFTGGGPGETRETAGVPSGGPVVAGFVAAPKQSNTTLWIVLGVIVLAILVVVAVFVGMILAQGEQPPPAMAQAQPPAAVAPAPPAAAAPAAPAPAAEKAADVGTATAEAGGEKAPDAGSAPVAEAPKPATKPATRRASPRRTAPRPAAPTPAASPTRAAPAAEDAPPPAEVAAAPAPKPTPPPPKPAAPQETSEVDDLLGSLNGTKPAAPAGGSDPVAAPDPMLSQKLTRRQILTVVKRNAGSVRKCKAQPPGASGTVTVKMRIAPNGTVSSAEIAGGPMKGTAQGNCVERTVKAFRFPQFGGDPMQINMPFAM